MTSPGTPETTGRDPWLAQERLLGHVSRPVVFDVGAHVGQTLRRYRTIFPTAEIHCFEPTPASYRELRRAARSEPRVSVHRLALSDRTGTGSLYTSAERSATNSLLPLVRDARRYYPAGLDLSPTEVVPLETVDRFCADRGIDRVHLLKMDVQGGERAVLTGAQGMIGRGLIDVIYTEVLFVPMYEGAAVHHELAALLAEHRYTLYGLYDEQVATNGQLMWADAIFVSDGLRSAVLDAFPPEP